MESRIKLEFEPIKNQKFEIGRTINFTKCDCEKCDFLHCPKNNYAVKTQKKIYDVKYFFELYKDLLIDINQIQLKQLSFFDKCEMRLNDFLITEFIDMLFRFPKNVYYSTTNEVVLFNGIYDDGDYDKKIFKTITLQTLGRKDNVFDVCNITIGNGFVSNNNPTVAQERLSIKISNALKELKTLIFNYYKDVVYKDWVIGWLSPEGKHYPCKITEHCLLAEMLGSTEFFLEEAGWVKVALSDTYLCTKRLTAEQRNWLSLNGYEVKEWD